MIREFPDTGLFVSKPGESWANQKFGYPRSSVLDTGYKSSKKTDMDSAHVKLTINSGLYVELLITSRSAPFNHIFKSFILDFIAQYSSPPNTSSC